MAVSIRTSLVKPVTPHAMRLNPVLRLFIGRSLRAEAERLAGLYVTGNGYRRALSAYVHQPRGVAALFLWEVRDFVDRMPGESLREVRDNVLAGLR